MPEREVATVEKDCAGTRLPAHDSLRGCLPWSTNSEHSSSSETSTRGSGRQFLRSAALATGSTMAREPPSPRPPESEGDRPPNASPAGGHSHVRGFKPRNLAAELACAAPAGNSTEDGRPSPASRDARDALVPAASPRSRLASEMAAVGKIGSYASLTGGRTVLRHASRSLPPRERDVFTGSPSPCRSCDVRGLEIRGAERPARLSVFSPQNARGDWGSGQSALFGSGDSISSLLMQTRDILSSFSRSGGRQGSSSTTDAGEAGAAERQGRLVRLLEPGKGGPPFSEADAKAGACPFASAEVRRAEDSRAPPYTSLAGRLCSPHPPQLLTPEGAVAQTPQRTLSIDTPQGIVAMAEALAASDSEGDGQAPWPAPPLTPSSAGEAGIIPRSVSTRPVSRGVEQPTRVNKLTTPGDEEDMHPRYAQLIQRVASIPNAGHESRNLSPAASYIAAAAQAIAADFPDDADGDTLAADRLATRGSDSPARDGVTSKSGPSPGLRAVERSGGGDDVGGDGEGSWELQNSFRAKWRKENGPRSPAGQAEGDFAGRSVAPVSTLHGLMCDSGPAALRGAVPLSSVKHGLSAGTAQPPAEGPLGHELAGIAPGSDARESERFVKFEREADSADSCSHKATAPRCGGGMDRGRLTEVYLASLLQPTDMLLDRSTALADAVANPELHLYLSKCFHNQSARRDWTSDREFAYSCTNSSCSGSVPCGIASPSIDLLPLFFSSARHAPQAIARTPPGVCAAAALPALEADSSLHFCYRVSLEPTRPVCAQLAPAEPASATTPPQMKTERGTCLRCTLSVPVFAPGDAGGGASTAQGGVSAPVCSCGGADETAGEGPRAEPGGLPAETTSSVDRSVESCLPFPPSLAVPPASRTASPAAAPLRLLGNGFRRVPPLVFDGPPPFWSFVSFQCNASPAQAKQGSASTADSGAKGEEIFDAGAGQGGDASSLPVAQADRKWQDACEVPRGRDPKGLAVEGGDSGWRARGPQARIPSPQEMLISVNRQLFLPEEELRVPATVYGFEIARQVAAAGRDAAIALLSANELEAANHSAAERGARDACESSTSACRLFLISDEKPDAADEQADARASTSPKSASTRSGSRLPFVAPASSLERYLCRRDPPSRVRAAPAKARGSSVSAFTSASRGTGGLTGAGPARYPGGKGDASAPGYRADEGVWVIRQAGTGLPLAVRAAVFCDGVDASTQPRDPRAPAKGGRGKHTDSVSAFCGTSGGATASVDAARLLTLAREAYEHAGQGAAEDSPCRGGVSASQYGAGGRKAAAASARRPRSPARPGGAAAASGGESFEGPPGKGATSPRVAREKSETPHHTGEGHGATERGRSSGEGDDGSRPRLLERFFFVDAHGTSDTDPVPTRLRRVRQMACSWFRNKKLQQIVFQWRAQNRAQDAEGSSLAVPGQGAAAGDSRSAAPQSATTLALPSTAYRSPLAERRSAGGTLAAGALEGGQRGQSTAPEGGGDAGLGSPGGPGGWADAGRLVSGPRQLAVEEAAEGQQIRRLHALARALVFRLEAVASPLPLDASCCGCVLLSTLQSSLVVPDPPRPARSERGGRQSRPAPDGHADSPPDPLQPAKSPRSEGPDGAGAATCRRCSFRIGLRWREDVFAFEYFVALCCSRSRLHAESAAGEVEDEANLANAGKDSARDGGDADGIPCVFDFVSIQAAFRAAVGRLLPFLTFRREALQSLVEASPEFRARVANLAVRGGLAKAAESAEAAAGVCAAANAAVKEEDAVAAATKSLNECLTTEATLRRGAGESKRSRDLCHLAAAAPCSLLDAMEALREADGQQQGPSNAFVTMSDGPDAPASGDALGEDTEAPSIRPPFVFTDRRHLPPGLDRILQQLLFSLPPSSTPAPARGPTTRLHKKRGAAASSGPGQLSRGESISEDSGAGSLQQRVQRALDDEPFRVKCKYLTIPLSSAGSSACGGAAPDLSLKRDLFFAFLFPTQEALRRHREAPADAALGASGEQESVAGPVGARLDRLSPQETHECLRDLLQRLWPGRWPWMERDGPPSPPSRSGRQREVKREGLFLEEVKQEEDADFLSFTGRWAEAGEAPGLECGLGSQRGPEIGSSKNVSAGDASRTPGREPTNARSGAAPPALKQERGGLSEASAARSADGERSVPQMDTESAQLERAASVRQPSGKRGRTSFSELRSGATKASPLFAADPSEKAPARFFDTAPGGGGCSYLWGAECRDPQEELRDLLLPTSSGPANATGAAPAPAGRHSEGDASGASQAPGDVPKMVRVQAPDSSVASSSSAVLSPPIGGTLAPPGGLADSRGDSSASELADSSSAQGSPEQKRRHPPELALVAQGATAASVKGLEGGRAPTGPPVFDSSASSSGRPVSSASEEDSSGTEGAGATLPLSAARAPGGGDPAPWAFRPAAQYQVKTAQEKSTQLVPGARAGVDGKSSVPGAGAPLAAAGPRRRRRLWATDAEVTNLQEGRDFRIDWRSDCDYGNGGISEGDDDEEAAIPTEAAVAAEAVSPEKDAKTVRSCFSRKQKAPIYTFEEQVPEDEIFGIFQLTPVGANAAPEGEKTRTKSLLALLRQAPQFPFAPLTGLGGSRSLWYAGPARAGGEPQGAQSDDCGGPGATRADVAPARASQAAGGLALKPRRSSDIASVVAGLAPAAEPRGPGARGAGVEEPKMSLSLPKQGSQKQGLDTTPRGATPSLHSPRGILSREAQTFLQQQLRQAALQTQAAAEGQSSSLSSPASSAQPRDLSLPGRASAPLSDLFSLCAALTTPKPVHASAAAASAAEPPASSLASSASHPTASQASPTPPSRRPGGATPLLPAKSTAGGGPFPPGSAGPGEMPADRRAGGVSNNSSLGVSSGAQERATAHSGGSDTEGGAAAGNAARTQALAALLSALAQQATQNASQHAVTSQRPAAGGQGDPDDHELAARILQASALLRAAADSAQGPHAEPESPSAGTTVGSRELSSLLALAAGARASQASSSAVRVYDPPASSFAKSAERSERPAASVSGLTAACGTGAGGDSGGAMRETQERDTAEADRQLSRFLAAFAEEEGHRRGASERQAHGGFMAAALADFATGSSSASASASRVSCEQQRLREAQAALHAAVISASPPAPRESAEASSDSALGGASLRAELLQRLLAAAQESEAGGGLKRPADAVAGLLEQSSPKRVGAHRPTSFPEGPLAQDTVAVAAAAVGSSSASAGAASGMEVTDTRHTHSLQTPAETPAAGEGGMSASLTVPATRPQLTIPAIKRANSPRPQSSAGGGAGHAFLLPPEGVGGTPGGEEAGGSRRSQDAGRGRRPVGGSRATGARRDSSSFSEDSHQDEYLGPPSSCASGAPSSGSRTPRAGGGAAGEEDELVPIGALPTGVYFDVARRLWRCQWREDGKLKSSGFSLKHYKTLEAARAACILYKCAVTNTPVDPAWLVPEYIPMSMASKRLMKHRQQSGNLHTAALPGAASPAGAGGAAEAAGGAAGALGGLGAGSGVGSRRRNGGGGAGLGASPRRGRTGGSAYDEASPASSRSNLSFAADELVLQRLGTLAADHIAALSGMRGDALPLASVDLAALLRSAADAAGGPEGPSPGF
ncbi:hypothetical protein BESB_032550 [Besnoitia besnoiti]|uniref:AP2/ERF domain-containing protein n=1 Tax=Besnoitia besnoiti TaxID=94643 RepID=A0A2A9LX42_BESBE|nr:uncharacterized protein BESB_032550 [Besnoitia besnoiti]PFH31058.1 hypothetical protein BESB_032550 [Besnoitia besnoiti]